MKVKILSCILVLIFSTGCKSLNEMYLIYAAKRGDFWSVQELTKSGLDVNILDNDYRTPLIHASANGHYEIVKFLLDSSANVNCSDIKGTTALIAAAYSGHSKVLEQLILNKANIDECDERGCTALIHAAAQGNLNCLKVLLNHNADYRIMGLWGSALHYAAREGKLDCLKELVARGVDINIQDKLGCTPLMYAIERKHYKVIYYLVDNGANVYLEGKYGTTAHGLAKDDQKILDILAKTRW